MTDKFTERERLLVLETKMSAIEKDIHAIRQVTDTLHQQSLFVRGAVLLSIIVGGLLTWGVNMWDKIR